MGTLKKRVLGVRHLGEKYRDVASKLKAYIRARSGMKTSDAVLARLSDLVRGLCDEAIATAGADNRKTVMDRDFRDPAAAADAATD